MNFEILNLSLTIRRTRGQLQYVYGVPCPFSIQGHLGSFSRTCLKIACNSKTQKTDGHRAKCSDICDSERGGGRYDMDMGYFGPFSVRGHLEVVQYTCLKIASNSKTAGHKTKRSKIWNSWKLFLFRQTFLHVLCDSLHKGLLTEVVKSQI